jgi:excisionase family DNA binding protein
VVQASRRRPTDSPPAMNNEEEARRLGVMIRQARRSASPPMTQAALAQALGVTQPSVSAWEQGKALPGPLTLLRLLSMFDLDLAPFSVTTGGTARRVDAKGVPNKSDAARPRRPERREPPARLAYSVKEVAEALGVSTDLIYDMCGRGELTFVRMGRRHVIPSDSIEAVLKRTAP